MRQARDYQQRFFPAVKLGLYASHAGRHMCAYPNDEPYEPVIDPADPRTEFYILMLDSPQVDLAGPLEGNLEDLDTWLDEKLLDFVDPSIVRWPRYEEGKLDISKYREAIAGLQQIVGGRVSVGTQLNAWCVTQEYLMEGARTASELGCEELLLFESTGIEKNDNWAAVKEVVAQFGS